MAEKEVVRLDDSMDNPHGVDQFDQTKQLGGQIDGNWLNDAPGKVKVIASSYRILWNLMIHTCQNSWSGSPNRARCPSAESESPICCHP